MSRSSWNGLLVAVIGWAALPCQAQGPVPFSDLADWESEPTGVSTGGAFLDLDRDGDLDLVVANGNDILRQTVDVYYNDGAGHYPIQPQWQSSDVDYHGHLSVGDVDGDGWPDVAVSVFLGAGGFGFPGHVKLYRNDGTGTLSSTPVWRSSDSFFSFSCALGDADGDGDLDLAVATGEPYSDPPDRNRVYYNVAGQLQTTPGWTSPADDHAMDVTFGDADGDGDLDLAFCLAQGSNEIFFQGPGGLAANPGWIALDNPFQNGNSLTFGDVDGDGFRELVVSDNNQLGGGAGVFKIYDNVGGTLQTTPLWSALKGYTSAVLLGDLHLDGFPDLLGGIWWGGTEIFLNAGGQLSATSAWQSRRNTVVEALFLGDVNGDGLRRKIAEAHPGDGVRRTFYLAQSPLHAIESVQVDGQTLSPSQYCSQLADGWIALDRAPQQTLQVTYQYSESLDLGVTNWDTSRGNYVFERVPLVTVDAQPTGSIVLRPGESLQAQVDLNGTTGRTENVLVGVVIFTPVGITLYPDVHFDSVGPFGQKSLSYSLPVPSNLPPAAFGSYTFAAAVLRRGALLDFESFVFSIIP